VHANTLEEVETIFAQIITHYTQTEIA
jgi:hypothetical protein